MSNERGRFMFAGHALGAAARFHRLYDAHNLNHVIPTLGASLVPVTGGRSEAHVDPFRFEVDDPVERCLLAVDRIDTWAEGRDRHGSHETELSIDIVGLEVVEMLRIDFVRLHMHTVRTRSTAPVVTTQGNRIEGMRLGKVDVVVTIDNEPLTYAGTDEQLLVYHQERSKDLPKFGDYYRCTLVRDIQLVGEDQDKVGMRVEGNEIVWEPFGRIILGEIHVKGHERRLTMVRLEMGSDAAGSGTAGDGQSNGSTGTG